MVMDRFHHHLKILLVRINKNIFKYLFSCFFKANRPGSKKYPPGISSPHLNTNVRIFSVLIKKKYFNIIYSDISEFC
jgi:hypothetical protein